MLVKSVYGACSMRKSMYVFTLLFGCFMCRMVCDPSFGSARIWTDSRAGLTLVLRSTWSTNSQTHMHSDSCAVTRAENGVPASDDIATRNNRSFHHRLQVSLGVLLVMAGLVFFVTMGSYTILIGLAIVFLGLLILIRAFCVVIKSSHVAVPGHFLLHPRTGTRYTHHQAIAVQR